MASQFNCLDQLNTYADFLSANPNIDAPSPQPLLWTNSTCSGNQILQVTDAFPNQSTWINPYGSNFNSLYVPAGWKVLLVQTAGVLTIQYPAADADESIPVLIGDFTNITFPGSDNVPVKDQVSQIQILTPPDTKYLTTWRLQMCNNEISTVVGARHLTSYQAGSPECDAFMSGYCQSVSTLGCAPNSTQPAPLAENLRYCVCLVEENCLRSTFCTPGQPNCTTNDAFEEFIPVTCFGKNCSIEGYRWGRMQNQRCNITLCQQIIRLVGSDIVVRGGSTMWCGNQAVPVTSVTPTPSAVPPSHGSAHPLSTSMWAAIGVSVFVLAVVVPLAIVIYVRSYKSAGHDASSWFRHSATPALPLNASTVTPDFRTVSTEAL